MSGRRVFRALTTALLGAVVLLLGGAPVAAGEANLIEMTIKATYLCKLAVFVTWPPNAFPAADAPLVICVQGGDPFGPLLERATVGQAIGSHPVFVRRMER